MPKKSAAKTKTTRSATPAKKVSVKKSAPKKMSLTQAFLVKEQEQFHKSHPRANRLIALFLVMFGLWVVTYWMMG